MEDSYQLLKDKLLISYQTSMDIRVSLLYDLLSDVLFSKDMSKIYDNEVIRFRYSIYIKFLNMDCELLSYLNSIINDINNFTKIEELLNILEENQKLEMTYSSNLAEYMCYTDESRSFMWQNQKEINQEILDNQDEYKKLYNRINMNNKKIEKIKRMEM